VRVEKEKLWKWLFEVKELLDSLGVPFFLSCGTCLWLVRDGDILDDEDIDVGVMEEYESKLPEIISAAKSRGWLVNLFRDDISGKGVLVSFFSSDHDISIGYADIAFYYRKDDKVWKGMNCLHCVPEIFDGKLFKSFDKITVRGVEWLVPSPVENYLDAIYGDWRNKRIGIYQYNLDYIFKNSPFYRKSMKEENRKEFLENAK
jgi:hypothetical protein